MAKHSLKVLFYVICSNLKTDLHNIHFYQYHFRFYVKILIMRQSNITKMPIYKKHISKLYLCQNETIVEFLSLFNFTLKFWPLAPMCQLKR
jgi:hypothetical protein